MTQQRQPRGFSLGIGVAWALPSALLWEQPCITWLLASLGVALGAALGAIRWKEARRLMANARSPRVQRSFLPGWRARAAVDRHEAEPQLANLVAD
jgi:hypothetical protein